MIDREQLAQRVEPLNRENAWLIRSPDSRIEPLETPFFQRGAVFRVVHLGGFHPVGFTVGCADPDFTVLLPVNPKGFEQLASRAGLRLDSSERRVKYVLTFLEATRDFGKWFQVLRSARDIPLIPNPSGEQQLRYQQLQEKLGKVIRPPTLSESVPGEVTLFAVQGRDLVKLVGKLAEDGRIDVASTVIEKDLPMVIVK